MGQVLMTNEEILKKLELPKGVLDIVIDTDTFNEVDDQFALVYALKSKERVNIKAVYAAPFYNDKSSSPADGMEKSYKEILHIYAMMKEDPAGLVFRGSKTYLPEEGFVESDAARDLVDKALTRKEDDPLYVVALGAITNVASAIRMCPEIVKKIVVIWLGGNAFYWPDVNEFNLRQDVNGARVLFDSGVPLMLLPCMGVVSNVHTTIPELKAYLEGKSEIADYLYKIVAGYSDDHFAWSKVIWDITTIAWIINPDWLPSHFVHSPIITKELTWSFDESRHLIRAAWYADRDHIFRDVFDKICR